MFFEYSSDSDSDRADFGVCYRCGGLAEGGVDCVDGPLSVCCDCGGCPRCEDDTGPAFDQRTQRLSCACGWVQRSEPPAICVECKKRAYGVNDDDVCKRCKQVK